MLITNRDIVHFSLDDYWHSNPHSRHHLTAQFRQNDNRVVWVNTFGMRVPSVRKRGGVNKILRKLLSFARPLRKSSDGMWVFSPVAIPGLRSARLKQLQTLILTAQLRFLFAYLGLRNPVLFVTSPMFGEVLDKLPRDMTLYYYSDDYSAYREITNRKVISELDKLTLAKSDAVLCASQMLYSKVKAFRSDALYFPHAVDFDHFNSARSNGGDQPKEMVKVPRPIVGYFGSLTDSNDLVLIKHIAESRPAYSIVLVGKPSHHYQSLREFSNVYLLGAKRYEELPRYATQFDVCFMAWKMTEWIAKSSPLKTMEYLSLGKPVVSYPIEEVVRKFSGVVSVAESKEEFLRWIDYWLQNDNEAARELRMESVRHETWANRYAQLCRHVASLTQSRFQPPSSVAQGRVVRGEADEE